MNQCEILNQLPDIPLTLSDTDVSTYNSNKEYFDKYVAKLQNYVEMDFDVESKRLKAAKNNLERSIQEASIHRKLSDELIKTNMLMTSQSLTDENDVVTSSLQMMSACPNEFMMGEQLRRYQSELKDELDNINLSISFCNAFRLHKYPNDDKTCNQLDKLTEKLNNDLRMLNESRDINKEITIKNIKNVIELIEMINKSNNIQYLTDSLYFDKRAYNLLKEIDQKYVEKTFGKDIISKFSSRILVDTKQLINNNLILLFLYQISKKINSSMKSKDYKSLVYKASIVHYLEDIEASTNESVHFSYEFLNILNRYLENDKISNYMNKHDTSTCKF